MEFWTHLCPLLHWLAKTLSAHPASHIEGRVRLPALMDGEHARCSGLQTSRSLHQQGALGPAEPCQGVLAVRRRENKVPWGKKLYSDRVSPWGEGLLSAPSWGFGKGRAESNLLPSLPPCQIPSQVVQKGQFLVNQSKRLPKKQMRRMSPLASPISPGCRAGRSALTMQTLWPGWRGGRWTGATLAEGTTPCRSSREHSTQ